MMLLVVLPSDRDRAAIAAALSGRLGCDAGGSVLFVDTAIDWTTAKYHANDWTTPSNTRWHDNWRRDSYRDTLLDPSSVLS